MNRRVPGGGASTALAAVVILVACGCSSDGEGRSSSSASPAGGAEGRRILVFGAEENRLNAYDVTDESVKQTVVPSAADDPANGRDINAQICFHPDGSRRFIAGEDTNQPDPPPGWGFFQLRGDRIGEFSVAQIGKLTPTYQPAQETPENYGCGFLSDGRLVTSDVGAQLPFEAANGQLIVWFPPFDSFDVRYCKIDVSIATAGGIHVDREDRVYVASNRPDLAELELGGIYRYGGSWPTSNDAAGGCGRTDGTGAPLVDAGRVTKSLFIPSDPLTLTPSAIAASGRGTYYVTSVLTGSITEYDSAGLLVRPVLTLLTAGGSTPYGIGVDSEGTIYFADLGIVAVGPAPEAGSLQRVRFANGSPQPPETIDSGLDFPDGIGVLEIGGE